LQKPAAQPTTAGRDMSAPGARAERCATACWCCCSPPRTGYRDRLGSLTTVVRSIGRRAHPRARPAAVEASRWPCATTPAP